MSHEDIKTSPVITGILVRCPEWPYCDYSKCSHAQLHKPNANCYHGAEGSLRGPECPRDCREEGK
jgi:hypothetical protein